MSEAAGYDFEIEIMGREPIEAIALCIHCTRAECSGDCPERKRVAQEARAHGRDGKLFELDGQRRTLAEWAALYQMSEATLLSRMTRCGMTLRGAVSKPVSRRLQYRIGGRSDTAKGWAERYGLSASALYWRIKKGMDIESAIADAVKHRKGQKRAV